MYQLQCGCPLVKPDSNGNIRYCKYKPRFTTNELHFRHCCGIHAKAFASKKKDNPSTECSICLCDCNAPHNITLSCSHSFHHNCIMAWFDTGNNTCPMCRNVCKNNPYILKKYIDRVVVITRKLEMYTELSKHLTCASNIYMQRIIHELEEEYCKICDYIKICDT